MPDGFIDIPGVSPDNAIPVLGGFYYITNDGKLYSVRNRKFLKPARDKYGYLYYTVSIDSKRTTIKAHRLVAIAFIPNLQNKPTVNHKNGIRTDNRVENLEWATSMEQAHDPLTRKKILQNAEHTDYRAMGEKRNFGRRKTEVYKDGILIGTYDSLTQAAKYHKTNLAKASECANGKRKSAGGVQFCYL